MAKLLRNDNVLRLIILIALIIGFGFVTDGVTYSRQGLTNILLQASVTGIAAVGQAFVILTGGIDLSMYGVGVLASVLGAATMTSRFDLNIVGGEPLHVVFGVALILMVGLAAGAINGLLVSRLKVPALIVTLGTWQICYGLAQLLGGGYTITNLNPTLAMLGQSSVFGIPVPVIEMFVLFAIAWYVLEHTSFGRAVYAVGASPASAHLSGIKVTRVQFMVFLISGLMVGLSALSIESRMMLASVRTLSGLQLDSIAAVAIGGVSIYGGRGSILGVLIGVLILAVIDSGLGAMGASTEVQNTVKGVIIILAVSIEYLRRGGRVGGAAALGKIDVTSVDGRGDAQVERTGTLKALVTSDNGIRLLVLIVLIAAFAVATKGTTLGGDNIVNILVQSAIRGIAACGQALVVLTTGLDLSVSGIVALTLMLGGSLITANPELSLLGYAISPVIATLLMLVVGTAFGFVNGFVVARFRLPAIIVTLGTWQIGIGLAYQVTGSGFVDQIPKSISFIGQGTFLFVPLPVIIFFLVVAATYFLLHHTIFGREVYAVGGNARTAFISGVRVMWVRIAVFAIAGLLYAIGAVISMARFESSTMAQATGLELSTIAAVAIGGVSLAGGRGTIIGILLGTLIIGVLDNGLSVMGVGPAWQAIVKGAIIIAAVALDVRLRRYA